jgi:anti-sigma B factor antagonist
MAECIIIKETGFIKVTIKGRIDSISAPAVEKEIVGLANSGEKLVACDFHQVNYISSAGLRIFLTGQQRMASAGGNLFLYGLNEQIFQVFKMGGFHNFLKIVDSENDVLAMIKPVKSFVIKDSKDIGNIHFEYIKTDQEPAKLNIYGSQDKLQRSEYAENDLVSVYSNDIDFGTGLATTGVNYEDYKNYFGEAAVINGSLFFYPAVKKTAVDFMLASPEMNFEYKFFHGFGYKSKPQYTVKYHGLEGFVDLQNLVHSLLELSGKQMIGLTFMTESKGIWGMNLTNVPILENKPDDTDNIFDQTHFSKWMNFPVEPNEINNLIIATGIAVKDKEKLSKEARSLFPKDGNFHIHGVIFDKELYNDDLDKFDEELNRILSNSEAKKVQHLLAASKFNKGIVTITDLKG